MYEADKVASILRERSLDWYLDDCERPIEANVGLYAHRVIEDIFYSLGYHDDPEDIPVHEFLRALGNLIDRPVASNIAADESGFDCNNCCSKFDKGMAHFDYCPHCGARIR